MAKKRSQLQVSDDPFNQINVKEAQDAAASKSKQAGNYHRKTITLPAEQIAFIKELAEENGFGILAFYRWLISQGLLAYDRGERPQELKKPIHEIEPVHPSSEV